jgi:hypothetical protein
MAKTIDTVSLLIQAGKTDTIYRDVSAPGSRAVKPYIG